MIGPRPRKRPPAACEAAPIAEAETPLPQKRRKVQRRNSRPNPEVIGPIVSGSKKKRDSRPWLKKKLKESKLAPGQPHHSSLLTDAMEEKICQMIREGSTWTNACRMCGVSLATVEDWKSKGLHLPDSRYALFLERAELAVMEREKHHVAFIATDLDWKSRKWLLMNWHPDRYRDRYWQELSGPDGAPIPTSVAPFVVNITLAPTPEDQQPQFTVRPHEPQEKAGNGARP
jgi:hypothetical protein